MYQCITLALRDRSRATAHAYSHSVKHIVILIDTWPHFFSLSLSLSRIQFTRTPLSYSVTYSLSLKCRKNGPAPINRLSSHHAPLHCLPAINYDFFSAALVWWWRGTPLPTHGACRRVGSQPRGARVIASRLVDHPRLTLPMVYSARVLVCQECLLCIDVSVDAPMLPPPFFVLRNIISSTVTPECASSLGKSIYSIPSPPRPGSFHNIYTLYPHRANCFRSLPTDPWFSLHLWPALSRSIE